MAHDLRQAGAALREIRELARLTQADVAAHFDVSDGAVSQWESGRTELKPSQLQRVADLVGLDFDAMLFKLGYPVSEDARERYTRWLLDRYAQPGAPIRASAIGNGSVSAKRTERSAFPSSTAQQHRLRPASLFSGGMLVQSYG